MERPSMETISIELEDGIARMHLDRPDKRNAMNQTMFSELGVAARYLRDEPEVKVAIITGRGKAFCAGLDLSQMSEFQDITITAFRDIVREMQGNFRAFELIEKPVIAMVNGPALGAGTEIALACDIVLASTEALMGLLEVNIGLVTDLGVNYRLPRLVGIHRAKELIMTGKKITGLEAAEIGLVNYAYPPGELEERTVELARQLKELSPLAVGLCKLSIDRNTYGGGGFEEGLEIDAQAQSLCLAEIMEKMKKSAGAD